MGLLLRCLWVCVCGCENKLGIHLSLLVSCTFNTRFLAYIQNSIAGASVYFA